MCQVICEIRTIRLTRKLWTPSLRSTEQGLVTSGGCSCGYTAEFSILSALAARLGYRSSGQEELADRNWHSGSLLQMSGPFLWSHNDKPLARRWPAHSRPPTSIAACQRGPRGGQSAGGRGRVSRGQQY